MSSDPGPILPNKANLNRRKSDRSAVAVDVAARKLDYAVAKGPTQAGHPQSQPAAGIPVRFTSNVVGSLILIADLAAFVLSAPVAILLYDLLRGSELVFDVHLLAFFLMLSSFLFIRSSRQAARPGLMDPIDGLGDLAFDAVLSSLVASALIWQAGLIENYSRGLTLLFLVVLIASLWASRPVVGWVIRALSSRGYIQQRIAFYGADVQSIELAKRLVGSLKLDHVRFVGVVDDRKAVDVYDGLPVLGGLGQLCELARRGEIDQVLINGSNLGRERVNEIVERLSSVCIDISLIPANAIDLAPNYTVNLLGNTPVLTLWQRPFRDINQVVKRAEDLFIASIALVALSPVLAVAALLVRLSGPGPILFVQPRIGFNNEIIHVIKFRTMYAHLTDLGASQTTTRRDYRVTPVGRILRKLSIDELPQLFNVLQGSMSLVGPRPHAVEMKVGDLYYHDAVSGYAGRHRVKPGITGLAQVKGLRGEVRTIERAKRRVELDKEYLERWSVWLDLKILLLTVRAVLFDRDAY